MKRSLLLLSIAGLLLVGGVAVGRAGGKGNAILDAAKENLSDPKKPFTMVVFLTVKEGKGKELEELFKPARQETRKEKGNIAYDMSRDLKDETKYYVYERWKSLAALEYHMDTPHIKTLLGKVGDVLAGPPEVRFFAVADE